MGFQTAIWFLRFLLITMVPPYLAVDTQRKSVELN